MRGFTTNIEKDTLKNKNFRKVLYTSNTEELKMYTIYSPAHHKDGIIRVTKEEAEANEADLDGVTIE